MRQSLSLGRTAKQEKLSPGEFVVPYPTAVSCHQLSCGSMLLSVVPWGHVCTSHCTASYSASLVKFKDILVPRVLSYNDELLDVMVSSFHKLTQAVELMFGILSAGQTGLCG